MYMAAGGIKGLIYLEARACFSVHTVEPTKRAKTAFFTLQAHISKSIGDTRNINTFS